MRTSPTPRCTRLGEAQGWRSGDHPGRTCAATRGGRLVSGRDQADAGRDLVERDVPAATGAVVTDLELAERNRPEIERLREPGQPGAVEPHLELAARAVDDDVDLELVPARQ